MDYLSIISSLGYSVDGVVENDSVLLVSDVIALRKKDLKNISDGMTKVESDPIKLPLDRQYIKLNLYELDVRYESIFNEAVREWNSLPNCNVLFYNPNDPEFPEESTFYGTSIFISENPNYIFPTNYPKFSFIQVSPIILSLSDAGTLTINTSNASWMQLYDDQKKWAIVHALGLLVGLLPTDEADSIMKPVNGLNANNHYSYWWGFSDNDKSDMMGMYPLIPEKFELLSEVTEYVTDVEYRFMPQVTVKKDYVDVTYEYSIESTNSIKSYNLTKNNDNTIDVKFYSAGTYVISCRIVSNDIIFAETSETISVSGDLIIPDNDDIRIGESFNIYWGCEEGANFKCYVKENIFGNNALDYSIVKTSPNEYSVKLSDYGYYVITIVKESASGAIIDTKELHIKRFYRPELSFPDFYGTEEVFDFRIGVFEIGYICPENMSRMTVTSANAPYDIYVGDGTELKNRLYLHRYDKYYRNAFIPPAPVCMGPAVDAYSIVELVYEKGDSGILTMPAGKNGNIAVADGWLRYQGYYAVIIPDDEVYMVQK